MNDIEREMNCIVDAVFESCVTTMENGSLSITKEEVFGRSKKENVALVRNMLSYHLHRDGFSTTTISLLLGRSLQSVRNMINAHDEWLKASNAYRIAHEQVLSKLKARNKQETNKV